MELPSNWIKRSDGKYDVNGTIGSYELQSFVENGQLDNSFGNVTGDLLIYNLAVEAIKISGSFAYGNFIFDNCKKLQELKGPVIINGDFKLCNCPSLTKMYDVCFIGGSFICENCDALKLRPEQLPHKVRGDFTWLNCPFTRDEIEYRCRVDGTINV